VPDYLQAGIALHGAPGDLFHPHRVIAAQVLIRHETRAAGLKQKLYGEAVFRDAEFDDFAECFGEARLTAEF